MSQQTIQEFLECLKNYQAEGLKLISEMPEGEAEDHTCDAVIQKLMVIWDACNQKMMQADFSHWAVESPLYPEVRQRIDSVLGVISSVIVSLENKKIAIQKILEELPHLSNKMFHQEENPEPSIFEVSV